MFSALGEVLSQFIWWFWRVLLSLLGVMNTEGGPAGPGFHVYSDRSGMYLLLPLFAIGIAASLIMFCAKLLRKILSRF